MLPCARWALPHSRVGFSAGLERFGIESEEQSMRLAGTIYLYCAAALIFAQAAYTAFFQEGAQPLAWISPIAGGVAVMIVAWKTRNL